jgi:hypothetical protein
VLYLYEFIGSYEFDTLQNIGSAVPQGLDRDVIWVAYADGEPSAMGQTCEIIEPVADRLFLLHGVEKQMPPPGWDTIFRYRRHSYAVGGRIAVNKKEAMIEQLLSQYRHGPFIPGEFRSHVIIHPVCLRQLGQILLEKGSDGAAVFVKIDSTGTGILGRIYGFKRQVEHDRSTPLPDLRFELF